MISRRSLACVLLTVLAGLEVGAQQITGSIRGTVVDPSGALVQSAAVSAQQTETGLTRTAFTDRDGAYVLVELPIGHYQIRAEAKGYQKYLQEGISLDVNQTATVNVHLKLGAETQQVEVKADAQLVQSTVSSLGQTVMEREILDLPLDGRNFSQLGTLQPGVVPLTPGLLQAGGPARAGQAYAVDGQRPESNNFLIDGADNVNAVDAGFVLKPPIDSIAEFRILTHNANAEFGRNTGSTTNIVTRGGTNSFHGAAWEFLRNDAMDASDFFSHSVQALKQNQFGGTFGGPILKDKTFSSDTTRASAIGRARRCLQRCPHLLSGRVTSRSCAPIPGNNSPAACASIRADSSSSQGSSLIFPPVNRCRCRTTSYPPLIRLRRMSYRFSHCRIAGKTVS